jgi:PTH1 family peptidyl-tRNA hydrolase
MNLSGNAVNYWMNKENIPIENILVIVDDIALPLGSIRMRPKGNDGGHNGLAHITSVLGTHDYPRIRFGIGNDFRRGSQIDFVLGEWEPDEKEVVVKRIPVVIEMIKSFAFAGLELTMTAFNKEGKIKYESGKENPLKDNPSA